MSWSSVIFRGILLVIMICTLLFLAELSLPMGALIVFLLTMSIGLTWAIINLLRDDSVLTDFFED